MYADERVAKMKAFLNGELKFQMGELVVKKSGSAWTGYVVGFYCTELTEEGYAVESDYHAGLVQIYPANALKVSP